MFWGLALESGKRYAKTVETPFRISQAVLDTTTADNEIVRVMVESDDCETLLCNLSLKHGILQSVLDLQFIEGEQIALYTYGGKGQVHLSGYVLPEEGEGSLFGEDEEEDLADEEEEEVSSDEDVPVLVAPSTSGKRKPESLGNPIPTKKTKTQNVETVKPAKMTVCEMVENGVKDQDDDDDEDDEDYVEGAEDSGEEEGSDEGEEEEGESDEEDMEDEEVDEEEDGDEEMEADATKTPKAEAKAEVKTPKAEVKTPKTETPKAESKTPKAEVKTPKTEVDVKQENAGSEMDTSITEAKSPKKEKKKKKKELLAINGETPQTPQTPKQKSVEKLKQNEVPTTPKQKDATPGKLDKTPKSQGKIETPAKSPVVSKAGGVICEDLVVGTGQEAKNGRMVSVYYEGRLKSNNKFFDATSKGPPFKFRLGAGEVIKGWDVGVNGMKIGGKRRVVCPPHMAYGKRGAPPDIPKNATLSFLIELKGIN